MTPREGNKTRDPELPAIEPSIESRSPVMIDLRRKLVWAISALGCVTLPVVAITGLIAYADYSVAKSEQTNLVGIVTVLAWVLGIALLIRVIRAWPRGSGEPLPPRRGVPSSEPSKHQWPD